MKGGSYTIVLGTLTSEILEKIMILERKIGHINNKFCFGYPIKNHSHYLISFGKVWASSHFSSFVYQEQQI